MSAKTVIFVLCAQALLIQSALSQVCGRSPFASNLGSYGLIGSASPFGLNSASLGNSLPCNGLAAIDNFTPAVEITPTTGGGLPVTSVSPMAPNSLVVASDNVYEGTLEVGGDLPFIGTVGLEGVLPTTGTGAVNHACGNGATRMVSQDGAAIASGLGPAARIAPGSIFNGIGAFGNTAAVSPFGFGTGLTGFGYPTTGCGNSGFAGAYPGVNNAFNFGAYGSAYGSALTPAAAYGAIGSGAAYGGAGEGNVAVAGELPVAGNAAVAGQVPIMGAVRFGGDVPAAGAVAISGKCACGCGSPYVF